MYDFFVDSCVINATAFLLLFDLTGVAICDLSGLTGAGSLD